MNAFDPSGIAYVPTSYEPTLLVLFNAGVPADEACRVVCHTFPFVTREKVGEWYNFFTNNNIKYQQPIPDHSAVEGKIEKKDQGDKKKRIKEKKLPGKKLLDFPPEVFAKIAESLTASDVKALKIVSLHTLENVNTDRVYSVIHLRLESETAKVMKMGPKGKKTCETFSKGKRSLADENDTKRQERSRFLFIDEAVKSLEEIIKRPEVMIKKLLISVADSRIREIEETERYFLEKIQKTMAGLKKLVNVEIFHTEVNQPITIRDFLTSLKPETLSEVKTCFSGLTTDMKEIVSLPHWPHLKNFYISKASNLQFESLLHLRHVVLTIPSITAEAVADYKKKLLEKQGLFSHYFIIENDYPLTDCLEQLKPYKERGIGQEEKYFFLNNQERCFFSLTHYSVKFKNHTF